MLTKNLNQTYFSYKREIYPSILIKYDNEMKIAIAQTKSHTTNDKVEYLADMVIDKVSLAQCFQLNKIILILNGKFYYIKNKYGPINWFVPTKEEQDLIFEILLQGE